MVRFQHHLFGTIGMPASEDRAQFQPLIYLAANWGSVRRFAMRRAAADGAADGLTGNERLSRLEDCADLMIRVIMERDYGPTKTRPAITEDEAGRVILGAALLCRKRFWKDGEGRRAATRKAYPYVSGMSATGDNPAHIVALADSHEAREALTGTGAEYSWEVPDGEYRVDGGTARPDTDGGMVHRNGRWRMDRRRGRPTVYEPCTVVDAADYVGDRPRFIPAPVPAPGKRTAGDRCAVLHFAPDVEAYRAQLREYYSNR